MLKLRHDLQPTEKFMNNLKKLWKMRDKKVQNGKKTLFEQICYFDSKRLTNVAEILIFEAHFNNYKENEKLRNTRKV